jgi:hypothetical protein
VSGMNTNSANSKSYNTVDRGPSRTSWPPAWLSALAQPLSPPADPVKGEEVAESRAPKSDSRGPVAPTPLPVVADLPAKTDDNRRLWVIDGAGRPLACKSLGALPTTATAWCYEGDERWTYVPQKPAEQQ